MLSCSLYYNTSIKADDILITTEVITKEYIKRFETLGLLSTYYGHKKQKKTSELFQNSKRQWKKKWMK